MVANFERREDVFVVELRGRLDFDTTEPFRKTCCERLMTEKIIFDMANLVFVGSLGLQEFVDTMDQIARTSKTVIRCCGVSSEFRRMFEASGIARLAIYDSRETALRSFAVEVEAQRSSSIN